MARGPSEPGQEIGCERVESLARIFSAIAAIVFGSPGFAPQFSFKSSPWPDACRGDPSADVCRSYLLLKLHAAEIAEPYLDAYCRITNISRATIVGWLPYVAAARLAEDVPNDFERLLEIVNS
jgi:hypothetical protein